MKPHLGPAMEKGVAAGPTDDHSGAVAAPPPPTRAARPWPVARTGRPASEERFRCVSPRPCPSWRRCAGRHRLPAGCSPNQSGGTGAVPRGALVKRADIKIEIVTHGQAIDGFWGVVRNGVKAGASDLGVTANYSAPTPRATWSRCRS